MASLKKPKSCSHCGCPKLVHRFKPERWECVSCGSVLAQRAERLPGVCRDCGATEEEKEFKKGKNLCLDCANLYMVEWRKKNPGWNSDPEFKKKRFEAVRRAKQKSPESFLKSLLGHLTRPSRKKGQRNSTNVNPKRLALLMDVRIDLEFLVGIWASQSGLCAITGLPMVHRLGDLCAISIDRIDNSVGYVPGNVHLVCQWVNKARGFHDLEEFKDVLDGFCREACS